MKKRIITSLSLMLILSVALIALTGCFEGIIPTPGGNGEKQIPVYQGMTITKAPQASQTAMLLGPDKDDFDYDKDNGNHNGHFKGDHTDRDEEIDEEKPFPENGENENIEEEIKSSLDVIGSPDTIYYATPGEDIYINIHIDNPDSFEIMSFTLNGKKYSSYMFEDGSDMETIVLKYNVGTASGIVEYTIDAIKYVDGTEIKDVLIDGDKTVRAGIRTEGQVQANISDIDIDTNALSFKVSIKDNDGLIAYSDGVLKAVLYDGFEIAAEKDLALGENAVAFDSLKTSTLYQYAVVAYYDDLSGDGFKMNVLYKDAFYTDAVVLFDNITVGQDNVSFSLLWHEDHSGKSVSALKLYQNDRLINTLDVNATSVEKLLSDNTYKLVAEYTNGVLTESIYLEFTTFAKATPEISVINPTKTQTSVGFEISETDADNVGAITKVELIHGAEVTTLANAAAHEITKLLSNNDYSIRVTYIYDLNDGEGEHTVTDELTITTDAKATPAFSIINHTKTQTSVGFEISETDADNVGAITKIELIHANGTVVADSLDQRAFTNLLSDNAYTVKVTYIYDLNDGEGVHTVTDEFTITTDAKATPEFSIVNPTKTQTSLGFGIIETDADDVGNITKIELVHANGTVVADSIDQREFANLLSDNAYTVKVTYVYNLNDGTGDKTEMREFAATTLAKAVPEISVHTPVFTQTSVGFTITENDVDNVGAITKIELVHANGTVVADSLDQRAFTNLLSANAYTVKVTYVYNLNDGTGAQTLVKELAVKTNAKTTPDFTIANTAKGQESLNFSISITDTDNVGAITKVELIHGAEVTTLANATAHEITKLLSNNDYSIRVTYTYNLNDGAGEQTLVKDLAVKTDAKATPAISIINPTKTQTSLGFEIDEIDADNVGIITKIELIHESGTVVADNTEARSFKNLLSDNDYTVKVTYTYDLNDGNGTQTETEELAVTTLAKKIPSIYLSNPTATQTSIGFTITEKDSDNIGSISKIELIHKNGTIVADNTDVRIFENLLSDNDYTVKVTYTYDLNDGKGLRNIVKSFIKTTRAKTAPEMWLDAYLKDQTSIEFTISETDVDNIGSISKIELIHKNGTVVADSTEVRTFENLLWGNKYTVMVTYTYDLNDGNGAIEITDKAVLNTPAKASPSISISDVLVSENSISAQYAVTDTDSVVKSYKVELYIGDTLVAENPDRTISFTSLNCYTDYTIRITVLYDLSDGNGEQSLVYEHSAKTHPVIDVISFEIIDVTNVKPGGNFYVQATLNNPSNVAIKSLIINGSTATVIDTSTPTTVFAKVQVPSSWAGSTDLSIDSLSIDINSGTAAIVPDTTVSDTLFVNGSISVTSITLLNSDYNPVDDYSVVFPSEKFYLQFTFNNPTGYDIVFGEYTATKLDQNTYRVEYNPEIGWNYGGYIDRVSYYNEYTRNNLSIPSSLYKHNIYLAASDTVKEISTADELLSMTGGYYYKLVNDIDLTGLTWMGGSLSGIFDGNGYAIKNLTFTEASSDTPLGLFSSGNGIVLNLTIKTSIIKTNAKAGSIGLLFGKTTGQTAIRNCTIDADSSIIITPFISDANVGGFIGNSNDNVVFINCENHATVNAAGNGAGFVGYAYGADCCRVHFYNCINGGNIDATVYSAGFIAKTFLEEIDLYDPYDRIFNIKFEECINKGSINSPDVAAGFVGYGDSECYFTFVDCTNSGSISAEKNASGFIAQTSGSSYDYSYVILNESKNTGKIESNAIASGFLGSMPFATIYVYNCINEGNVTGASSASGFVAYGYGYDGGTDITISRSSNYGTIAGQNAGGFVGYFYSESYLMITSCLNAGEICARGDKAYAGGLIGNYSRYLYPDISDSINTGTVTASGSTDSYAGGLVGYVDGDLDPAKISNSISSATVTASVSTNSYAGNLIGYSGYFCDEPEITNSYSLSSENDGYNGDTCTIEQLNSKEFYTDTLGWSEDIWDLSELDIENGKCPTIKNA